MAKKTVGRRKSKSVNKAQAIRDEFTSQGPSTRPKDVIAALKARGIVVSSAQVSNVKASMGKKKRGPKARPSHATNGMLSLEVLLEAKKLAARVGGVETARRALDVLARLS